MCDNKYKNTRKIPPQFPCDCHNCHVVNFPPIVNDSLLQCLCVSQSLGAFWYTQFAETVNVTKKKEIKNKQKLCHEHHFFLLYFYIHLLFGAESNFIAVQNDNQLKIM